MEGGLLTMISLGVVLGLRHGIDWDHIAAITDITGSTTVGDENEDLDPGDIGDFPDADQAVAVAVAPPKTRPLVGVWKSFFLAELYALGHASVVVVLGLLAIWVGALLPKWIDPLMERVVGVTLVVLGVWIFYSIWRYGRSFRLRSRWMLVFSLAARGWRTVKGKITGHAVDHSHDISRYSPKAAYGVGMIHGFGAETGTQTLLLASAAGATSTFTGSFLLLSFVLGLIISNSLVAAFSSFGFVSAAAKRNVYTVLGVTAAVFSLVVGAFFLTGQGTNLPDLQGVVNHLLGAPSIRIE